ncbi:MAG: class I SAM-dependent methyltransferase [Candidatus Dormibacteraeota bacterium]|nr:class I SAM-dependent methyltransferase [Candidatus Dormibacteraeota bacterium]
MGGKDLLQEQVAYYRARAPEYDQWWNREGAWDLGPEFNRAWAGEIDRVRAILDAFGPGGDVLELAAGTGGLTVELARHANRLTAVDSSPEALALNRAKLAGSAVPVEYVVADLFEWKPPRRYDLVFFSFWLSHVPAERFEAFWDLVAGAVAPGGRFFLLDNATPRPELRRRFPHVRLPGYMVEGPRSVNDLDEGVSLRQVSDGRRFRIVKRYWQPDQLRVDLERLGWQATAAETDWAFLYAYGVRAGQSTP